MKWFILSCFFFFAAVSLSAQKKYGFRSQNFVGVLEGNEKTALQFQTINGCGCGNWFVGIGTGIDAYLYRSVPLFLSINRDFLIAKRIFSSLSMVVPISPGITAQLIIGVALSVANFLLLYIGEPASVIKPS